MEQLYYYLPHFIVLGIIILIILAISPVVYRIARDICVNPVTGKLAEKSTYAFGAYVLGMLACLNDFIHLSFNPEFDFHFDKVPFEVKVLLFTASGVLAVSNVAGKFFSRKTKDGYGNELAPIVTDKPVDVIAPLEPDALTGNETEDLTECPAVRQAKIDAEKSSKAPFIAYPDRSNNE